MVLVDAAGVFQSSGQQFFLSETGFFLFLANNEHESYVKFRE